MPLIKKEIPSVIHHEVFVKSLGQPRGFTYSVTNIAESSKVIGDSFLVCGLRNLMNLSRDEPVDKFISAQTLKK